jgi:hypothetical protein
MEADTEKRPENDQGDAAFKKDDQPHRDRRDTETELDRLDLAPVIAQSAQRAERQATIRRARGALAETVSETPRRSIA